MLREETTEVLVVGAGPVGLVAAIRLAESGVRVKVVDQEPGTATHSYACALHPGTLQLLAGTGLAEEMIAMGRRVDTVVFYDRERPRAEIKLSAMGGDYPFLLVLPQSAIEEVLGNRLARRHHVKIDWNHRLSTLRLEGGRVQAGVEKLVITAKGYIVPDMEWVVGKTLRVGAGYVIGADGHHSHVRQCLGIDYDRLSEPMAFEVCEFQTDADLNSAVRVVLDDATTNVLWPLPGGRCRWSFQLARPDLVAFPSKERSVIEVEQPEADEELRRHVGEMVKERAPWFEGTIGEIVWSTQVRFDPGLSRRFGQGHCWLAGDAAHQTGPVGMQSMNAGMREAAGLAENLSKILREQASPDSLEAWARDRRKEWGRLLGVEAAPKPRMQTDPWVRERGARILSCLPASGEHLTRLLDQIGLDA